MKKRRTKKKKTYTNSFLIIVALFISLLSFAIVNLNRPKQTKAILTKYNGIINGPNYTMSILEKYPTNANIAISPVAINSSIGLLYMSTDNNSHKEIEHYLNKNQNINEINQELITKYSYLPGEKTKEEEYYDTLVTEFNSNYSTINLETLNRMNTTKKEELILHIKKIKMSTNGYSIKDIEKYKLNKDEKRETSQEIMAEIIDIKDTYIQKQNAPKTILYNKLYYDTNAQITFDKKYLKDLKTYYNLEPIAIDFKDQNTPTIINNDLSTITDNKVNQIVKSSDLYNQNIIINNTLYFNNTWSDKSHVYEEKEDYFNDELVTMISSKEVYLSNDKAEGFIKEFSNNYSFVAFYPKDNVKLDEINVEQLISSRSENNQANITFPEFKYVSINNLKDYYTSNNIQEIFTSEANFNVSSKEIQLANIYQKIYIEIGNEGTFSSIKNNNTIQTYTKDTSLKELKFNKPFYYLIIDNTNDNVLIAGHFVKP